MQRIWRTSVSGDCTLAMSKEVFSDRGKTRLSIDPTCALGHPTYKAFNAVLRLMLTLMSDVIMCVYVLEFVGETTQFTIHGTFWHTVTTTNTVS